MMRCALCSTCEEHPRVPGRCVYSGPFDGFTSDTEIDVEAYIARVYGPFVGVRPRTWEELRGHR